MNSIDITKQDVETAAAARDKAWEAWMTIDLDEDDTAAKAAYQWANQHWRIQSALHELQSRQAATQE